MTDKHLETLRAIAAEMKSSAAQSEYYIHSDEAEAMAEAMKVLEWYMTWAGNMERRSYYPDRKPWEYEDNLLQCLCEECSQEMKAQREAEQRAAKAMHAEWIETPLPAQFVGRHFRTSAAKDGALQSYLDAAAEHKTPNLWPDFSAAFEQGPDEPTVVGG